MIRDALRVAGRARHAAQFMVLVFAAFLPLPVAAADAGPAAAAFTTVAADRKIAAGYGHNLFANAAGQVWGWGWNELGVLGTGTTAHSSLPVRAGTLTGVVAVAVGEQFSAALDSGGTVWTWGHGRFLGLGPVAAACKIPFVVALAPCEKSPVAVSSLPVVTAIAAGPTHAVALLADGTLRAWGANDMGQLGDGTTSDRATPVTVSGMNGVVAIAAGASFTLALKLDGTVWSWGDGSLGQLGIGSTTPSLCSSLDPYEHGTQSPANRRCAKVPVRITTLANVSTLSARGRHALALLADGTVRAWGSNQAGQIGDGTTTHRLSPVAVPGLAGIVKAVAGFSHSLALASDGTLRVWGLDDRNQIGGAGTLSCGPLSDYRCAKSPVVSATNTGAVSIFAGAVHSMTLLPTGRLSPFGFNGSGQLGYGLPTSETLATLADYPGLCTGCPIGGGGQPAPGSQTSIGLASNAGGIELELADEGVAFATTTAGAVSPPVAIRFGNLLDDAISIVSVATSGSFSQTHDCGVSLAGHGDCLIQVAFAPAAAGPNEGSLTITTSLAEGPVTTLRLSGLALAPPLQVPGAPTGVSAVGGSLSATVAFTPPASDGGAPILDYTVTSSPGAITATGAASPIVVSGLAAATIYTFTVTARNSQGSGPASPPSNAVTPGAAPVLGPARLGNISTRMHVFTGDNVLIGGFIIGGSALKTVVVRARGPSLAPFGITNFLANPKLDLFSGQTVIASNDDWSTTASVGALQSSGFAPAHPQEAAVIALLPPGPYTVVVSGVGGTTGVGIVEVFEVDLPEAPLLNISTRGYVYTGDDVMIGGFIIQGDAPQTVVVRARGPSLSAFGIATPLMDPVLQLYSGQTVIASNDDWQQAPGAGLIQSSGFAPSDLKESAIRITLDPGPYTAIVTGKGGTTGVAIIEVFAQ